MIHAPSGIAQAEANVRVWVGTCPRCSSGSTARSNRQRNSDVRWTLGCHWAIEPHCRGRGGYYEQQPTRRHLLCLVFDGHSTGGFVLFGAVTCACIESERYSRPVARCADGACGPLCGFGSWVRKEWHLMLRSFPLLSGDGGDGDYRRTGINNSAVN
ncbi:hypothetical protein HDV63DRAFT_369120 [Trichoderma sp. SZMC 28014]